MYLARKIIQGKTRYFIRESYREKGCLRSRDLCDLGANPDRYIRYPGGNSYYIDDSVEEAITAAGSKSTLDELDDIFWNFLKPEIQRKLEPFRRRELMSRSAKRRPLKKTKGSYHVFGLIDTRNHCGASMADSQREMKRGNGEAEKRGKR